MPARAPENWSRTINDHDYIEFHNKSAFGYSETVTVVQVGDKWRVVTEESDTFSGTEENTLGEYDSRERGIQAAQRYMRQ